MNILQQEMREQPACVERCLTTNAVHATRIAAQLHGRNISHIALLARGTSRHAALYASYLLGWHHEMSVQLLQPSLTTFLDCMPLPPSTAVIAVSQSGSSPDLCHALRTAQTRGAYGLAVTNTPESPLAQEADDTLNIQAGPEQAVAATKTYINQLVTLALLSQALGTDTSAAPSLTPLPGAVHAMFELEDQIRDVAQDLHTYPAMLVVGRGFHHATACETALKLQELTYTYALPFTSADLLHGPIALLDDRAVLICLDVGSQPNPHFTAIEARAAQAGTRLVVLSDHPERWQQVPHMIVLPTPSRLADCYSPIPTIVAGQLLAMYIGQAKGLDVVAPRFLTKETLTT